MSEKNLCSTTCRCSTRSTVNERGTKHETDMKTAVLAFALLPMCSPAPDVTDGYRHTDKAVMRLCPQWEPHARIAGWSQHDRVTLDRVIWNESRCQPWRISPTNDYGLVQINERTWSSLIESHGDTIQDTLNPLINLVYAKLISNQARSYGWCRWQPWHGYSGDYC